MKLGQPLTIYSILASLGDKNNWVLISIFAEKVFLRKLSLFSSAEMPLFLPY
jgi:hypothetical protein